MDSTVMPRLCGVSLTETICCLRLRAASAFAPGARARTDTFIRQTKKLYSDTRTQRNLSKLNEELAEVHSIMTKNIAEVLGQGEKLDSKCY